MNPGGAADVAEEDQKIQLFIHAFNQIKEVPRPWARPQRGWVKLAGSWGEDCQDENCWDGAMVGWIKMDQDGSRWIDLFDDFWKNYCDLW